MPDTSTWLPMHVGAKCGKVTCCGLWAQRSNPGRYGHFEQSFGVGSREVRLPPINGWQVRDTRLTAYTLLYFLLFLTASSSENSAAKQLMIGSGSLTMLQNYHKTTGQEMGAKAQTAPE